jgi:hypothetical protein
LLSLGAKLAEYKITLQETEAAALEKVGQAAESAREAKAETKRLKQALSEATTQAEIQIAEVLETEEALAKALVESQLVSQALRPRSGRIVRREKPR